jgi:lysophospholipase L1-like esterase
VWLQHRVFQKTSTRVERYFYQRYYNKILNKVESLEDESISVLRIPDTFVIQSNYLSDWVHLSHDGHTKMSKLVSEHIDDILEINHEERRA